MQKMWKEGHFARVCKSKSIQQIEMSGEKEFPHIQLIKPIYKIESENYFKHGVIVNGNKIIFVIDSGSPITILPRKYKEQMPPLHQVTEKYTDVNKNAVKFEGECTVAVETPNGKKNLPLLISSREDFTPLLGLNWFKPMEIKLRTNEIARINETDQSENGTEEYLFSKYYRLFEVNKTIKDVKVQITLKPEINRYNKKQDQYRAICNRRYKQK